MTARRASAVTLIRAGDRGPRVRDLQRRLQRLGYEISPSERGHYGAATEQAIRAFQADRRIRVDGLCGRETWARLVEAGHQLGDRALYERSPMLRGDDVGTLQRRLNGLGFDAGREDAIFGPDTTRAVREFQTNAGISADGICGPVTLDRLDRLDRLAAGSVAALREREALREPQPEIRGRRVFVAVEPGFEALADLVVRGLETHGAHTLLDRSGADESLLADHANRFEADLFLYLRYGDRRGFHCAYFQSRNYRSEAGHTYAWAIHRAVVDTGLFAGDTPDPEGMSFPVLRETRMAAVVCEPTSLEDADATARLFEHAGQVAVALVAALESRPGLNQPSSPRASVP